MATALAKSKKLIRYARAFLGPGYQGRGEVRQFSLLRGSESVEVLQSGTPETGRIFLLTPGFGAGLKDYGPLVAPFEKLGLVIRLRHPGSDRRAGLRALLKFLGKRLTGKSVQDAAKAVRAWIHGESHRRSRLRQLEAASRYCEETYPEHEVSVMGHSFGTDTALLFALQHQIHGLYLFSNHPPGYLIARSDYSMLKARHVWIFTGTRDVTRDGVGPEERLKVSKFLDPLRVAGVHCLEGVSHMDFAFLGWGPAEWQKEMSAHLFL